MEGGLDSDLRELGLQGLHLLFLCQLTGDGVEAESDSLPCGDALPAQRRIRAGRRPVRHHLPAVLSQQLTGMRRVEGIRIGLLRCRHEGAGRRDGGGAVGRGGCSSPEVLDPGRLVDQRLHRLPDVQLVQYGRDLGVGVVQHEVVRGPVGPGRDRIALAAEIRLLLEVLRGQVAVVDGSRAQRVHFRDIARERLLDELADMRVVWSHISLVGHEDSLTGC